VSSIYKSIKDMSAQAGKIRDYKIVKGGTKTPQDEFGKLVWWIDLKHGKKKERADGYDRPISN
jgi:hypothetical protein